MAGGTSTTTPTEGPRDLLHTGGEQLDVENPADTSGLGYGGNDVTPIDNLVFASPRTPVPNAIPAGNGHLYESNDKHTPGAPGSNRNAGVEPRNSLDLFNDSRPSIDEPDTVRYTVDSNGNIHRFSNNGLGTWHWSGSTSDSGVPLNVQNVPKGNRTQERSSVDPVYNKAGK